MIFSWDEAPQLQEDEPETGVNGLPDLPDSNGTWREETVEDEHGERRRRGEQVTDEEDDIEESPPRRRQCVEHEDADDEPIDFASLERNSSPLWRLSPTLVFVPSADAPSSSEHFWWMMMMREQMNDEEDSDEEAPPRRRQHVELEDDDYEVSELSNSESSSPPLWSLFPALECIHNMQEHSSSEHFCGRRRRREQMTEEDDSDEEAPPKRRLRAEREYDED